MTQKKINNSSVKKGQTGEKQCFYTKQFFPREKLIRFVVDPQDTICFDCHNSLPGRGFWLTPDSEILKTVIAKNLFSKVAQKKVNIPCELPTFIQKQLYLYTLSLLSLLRKSGCLLFGFTSVKKGLTEGKVIYICEAHDVSKKEQERLISNNIPTYTLWTKEELGTITGQAEQTHLGILANEISQKLLETIQKLISLKN